LSRYIARQVTRIASVSAAMHRGERPPVADTPIKEFDDMAQALGAVDKREERTQLALMNMTARNDEAKVQLESAKRDALTGLPARSLFLEMTSGLCHAVAARGGRKLALLFIDLDGFKGVNDAYGHAVGDQVLVRTAEVLRALTRESDTAGRLGGDEFVVCLSADDEHIEATAASVAARVVERVHAIGFGVGCSIGISVWPVDCPDLLCALRRADEAMYEAKRRGKNGFVIFNAGPKTDASAWATLAPAHCHCNCTP
jgi:diguanylate cyclase (GGDEF)-like protein